MCIPPVTASRYMKWKPIETRRETGKSQSLLAVSIPGRSQGPAKEQNPQEVCLYQEAEKPICAVVQAATQVDVGADTASALAQGRNFLFPWGSLRPALKVFWLMKPGPPRSSPLLKVHWWGTVITSAKSLPSSTRMGVWLGNWRPYPSQADTSESIPSLLPPANEGASRKPVMTQSTWKTSSINFTQLAFTERSTQPQ